MACGGADESGVAGSPGSDSDAAQTAAPRTPREDDGRLYLAVAQSLRPLFEDAAQVFSAEHPGLEWTATYDTSPGLVRLIAAGQRFDVFVSADRATVDRLGERALAGSRTEFLANDLALLANGTRTEIVSPQQLATASGRIAVGSENVPIGNYTRTYLESAGLSASLRGRLIRAGDEARAVSLVESGRTDFAFCYATDAALVPGAALVWLAGPAEDPGIVYVACAVTGASDRAQDLLAWLASSSFQDLAWKHGFRLPTK